MEARGGTWRRPIHPIGVVAQRTGLSPELVRAWERRYGVVEPIRDDAGRRLYSDADVERLRLLGQATGGGRNIGQVAALPTEELAGLVRADEEARRRTTHVAEMDADAEAIVAEAFDLVRVMDGDGLEETLRRAAAVLGAWRFLLEVVAPLFRRVGEEWHAGELGVGAEHLASSVTRPILAQVRGSLAAGPDAPLLLVATPSGESHEIGALLSAGAAAVAGWRVAYLGPDLPAAEIAAASALKRARAIALSVVNRNGAVDPSRELAILRRQVPSGVPILVGGAGGEDLHPVPEGVMVLATLDELRAFLRGG